MATITQIYDPDGDLTFILKAYEATEEKIEEAKSDKTPAEGSDLFHKIPSDPVEIRMKVSCRDVKRLSPVLRAMFEHSFKEGEALRINGAVEVALPDDDPQPFEILMNIAHSKARHIPRKLDLENLYNVAVLIDKYQAFDTVSFHVETWCNGLGQLTQKMCEEDLTRWLSVTWICRRHAQFGFATKLAALNSNGVSLEGTSKEFVETLIMPDRALAAIESNRIATISQALSALQNTVNFYLGPAIRCTSDTLSEPLKRECDDKVLGALFRHAKQNKLMHPSPQPPYTGFSFRSIQKAISRMQLIFNCQKNGQSYRSGPVAFQHEVQKELDRVLSAIEGDNNLCLKLDDYLEVSK